MYTLVKDDRFGACYEVHAGRLFVRGAPLKPVQLRHNELATIQQVSARLVDCGNLAPQLLRQILMRGMPLSVGGDFI